MNNLEGALAWHKAGRATIPVDPTSKRSLIPWKQYQEERPTVVDISGWWQQTPDAKIGLVTGRGLAVLDIDLPELADRLEQQLKNHCPLVRTPSGGLHAYFQEEEFSSSGPLVPGVADLKATGGYVVAPPSEGYKKQNGIKEPLAIPNLRAYAQTLLAGYGYTVQTEKPKIDLSDGKKLSEGGRNDTLTRIAGQLRRDGMEEEEIYETLSSINEKRCEPILPYEEVRAIAHSVSRYAPQPPPPTRDSPLEVRSAQQNRHDVKVYSAAELVAAYNEMGSRQCYSLLGKEGYIFKNWTHLISGYAKSGKTTLLCTFLAENQVKTLYIAEESAAVWGERIKETHEKYGHVTFAPALNAPADDIINLIEKSDAEIVIIDTIRNLLGFYDENNNSEVVRKLVPVIGATQKSGKTLLLTHHTRKGSGQYGEGAAGAGAFLGVVDIGLEVRRDSFDSDTPRREIHGWGRIHQIEPLSYELRDDALIALGSPKSVQKQAVKEQVLEMIGEDKVGSKELWESMGDHRPSAEQVRKAMVELAQEGVIFRDPPISERAVGKRNVAFWRPSMTSNGTSNNLQPLEVDQNNPKNSLPTSPPTVGGLVGGEVVVTNLDPSTSNEPPTTQTGEKANPRLLEDTLEVFGDSVTRVEDIPL